MRTDTLWIVFNGEIYNHAEIRNELVATGRHSGRPITRIPKMILHAFEEWGIDCVQRFRGMFAIALWDARKREMWLIRDRIGIKPLYYSVHQAGSHSRSEIKALLQGPGTAPRGQRGGAISLSCRFYDACAANAVSPGIHKLAGGDVAASQGRRHVHEERYWDVWDHTTPLLGVSEEEVAERVLAELRTAVALRKVSDVPVGVFLSGGIDSSTNAALFSEGETASSRRSRSATRASTTRTRTNCITRDRWPKSSDRNITSDF